MNAVCRKWYLRALYTPRDSHSIRWFCVGISIGWSRNVRPWLVSEHGLLKGLKPMTLLWHSHIERYQTSTRDSHLYHSNACFIPSLFRYKTIDNSSIRLIFLIQTLSELLKQLQTLILPIDRPSIYESSCTRLRTKSILHNTVHINMYVFSKLKHIGGSQCQFGGVNPFLHPWILGGGKMGTCRNAYQG